MTILLTWLLMAHLCAYCTGTWHTHLCRLWLPYSEELHLTLKSSRICPAPYSVLSLSYFLVGVTTRWRCQMKDVWRTYLLLFLFFYNKWRCNSCYPFIGDFLRNVHLPLSLSISLSLSYIFSLCQTVDGVCESPRMCTHRHWLVENLFPHTLLTGTSWLYSFYLILPWGYVFGEF